MSKLTLEDVQTHAKELGYIVVEDHVRFPGDPAEAAEGYWIEHPVTGEGPWEDDNFSTSLEEVAGKLCALTAQCEVSE